MSTSGPVTRFALQSSDPEEYDDWIRADYVDFRRRLRGDAAGRSFSYAGAAVGTFSIGAAEHGMESELETDTLDDAFVVPTTTSGHVSVSTADITLDPAIGQPYLMPPGRPWVVRWSEFAGRALRIDRSVLDSAASDLGWQGGGIAFSGWLPTDGMGAYLEGMIAHVRDHVLVEQVPATPLMVSEAARSMALAVLLAFPNNVTDHLAGPDIPVGAAAPATVRRAMEFIDTHAHEELDLGRIATVSRIGPRGLQAAFKKHRGQTPLEYLRRVRLERAHRDLQVGDPTIGDSVAGIAARWGFAHAGRFSVEYRRTYGQPPSHTLRT